MFLKPSRWSIPTGYFIIYHTVGIIALAVDHVCPEFLVVYLVTPSYWAANPTRARRLEVVGARILALRQLFLERGDFFLGGCVSVGYLCTLRCRRRRQLLLLRRLVTPYRPTLESRILLKVLGPIRYYTVGSPRRRQSVLR